MQMFYLRSIIIIAIFDIVQTFLLVIQTVCNVWKIQ